MTNAQFEAYVDTYITTNGTKAISGAILNETLKNMILSLLFAQIERRFQVACSAGAARSIAFDNAMPSTDYTVIPYVRDSGGNPVTVKIDPALQTTAAFFVEVSHNCTIDFVAIEHY